MHLPNKTPMTTSTLSQPAAADTTSQRKSNNENVPVWTNLLHINLTNPESTSCLTKALVLKSLSDGQDLNIKMVDIRGYSGSKPSQSGVCLTPTEFNWLCKKFFSHVDSIYEDSLQSSRNKARVVTIFANSEKYNGYIIQLHNGGVERKVSLRYSEVSRLLKHAKCFMDLMEWVANFEEETTPENIKLPFKM